MKDQVITPENAGTVQNQALYEMHFGVGSKDVYDAINHAGARRPSHARPGVSHAHVARAETGEGRGPKTHFKREAAKPSDQTLAKGFDALMDEQGHLDDKKLAASGLSEAAQDKLRAAHEAVMATTQAARATGRLSEDALAQNHSRALMGLLRAGEGGGELIQYAHHQIQHPAASQPLLAQATHVGPPARAHVDLAMP